MLCIEWCNGVPIAISLEIMHGESLGIGRARLDIQIPFWRTSGLTFSLTTMLEPLKGGFGLVAFTNSAISTKEE